MWETIQAILQKIDIFYPGNASAAKRLSSSRGIFSINFCQSPCFLPVPFKEFANQVTGIRFRWKRLSTMPFNPASAVG